MNRTGVQRAESRLRDAVEAVKDISSQLNVSALDSLFVFYSPYFDVQILHESLRRAFSCTIVGCSTAGHIGSGFFREGLVALGLPSDHFRATRIDFNELANLTPNDFTPLVQALKDMAPSKTFAISLIDGLSHREENFLASLSAFLGKVPLVGGSAGDDMNFRRTTVFTENGIESDAASVSLIETDLPFEIFQLQHFRATAHELVTTRADPENRTVKQIDGGNAAEEYAHAINLTVDQLTPEVFSRHPLMLQIGEDWYVRAIQKVLPDGALVFYGAVEEGLPLTVAEGTDLISALNRRVSDLRSRFPRIAFSFGCDCILRRLEMSSKKLDRQVEELYRNLNLFGFHTYGEHFNSVHLNQTLTGVVVGYE